MDVVLQHPLIDDALDGWEAALGVDRARYTGHVYRVFNFARRLVESDRHDDVLAIASAFHDLGIWSDGTFDYLPPSVIRARAFLGDRALGIPGDLVADAIENHHVLLPLRPRPNAVVAEAFRLADRVDVSGGLLRSGLEREAVRDIVRAFPFDGFHHMLVRTAIRWFVRHPLRPLPMLRLRG